MSIICSIRIHPSFISRTSYTFDSMQKSLQMTRYVDAKTIKTKLLQYGFTGVAVLLATHQLLEQDIAYSISLTKDAEPETCIWVKQLCNSTEYAKVSFAALLATFVFLSTLFLLVAVYKIE